MHCFRSNIHLSSPPSHPISCGKDRLAWAVTHLCHNTPLTLSLTAAEVAPSAAFFVGFSDHGVINPGTQPGTRCRGLWHRVGRGKYQRHSFVSGLKSQRRGVSCVLKGCDSESPRPGRSPSGPKSDVILTGAETLKFTSAGSDFWLFVQCAGAGREKFIYFGNEVFPHTFSTEQ